MSDGDATFATRNPLQDVQPSRVVINSHTKFSNAEKATYAEQRQVKKDANQALTTDIENWMVQRKEVIQELAKKHAKIPSYI
jgi:hypothetical protein